MSDSSQIIVRQVGAGAQAAGRARRDGAASLHGTVISPETSGLDATKCRSRITALRFGRRTESDDRHLIVAVELQQQAMLAAQPLHDSEPQAETRASFPS